MTLRDRYRAWRATAPRRTLRRTASRRIRRIEYDAAREQGRTRRGARAWARHAVKCELP